MSALAAAMMITNKNSYTAPFVNAQPESYL